MQNIVIIILLSTSLILGLMSMILAVINNKIVRKNNKALTHYYNLLVKIQSVLKNRITVNETTEKAEIIYQSLLEDLIPIMAAIDVMPRTTTEHPLWRALGGIKDAYAKNPFVLEKLRRAIKLDSNINRNVNHYLNQANTFLQHLSANDSDGILSTTFTDGMLGQSLTFFAQAQTLANTDK